MICPTCENKMNFIDTHTKEYNDPFGIDLPYWECFSCNRQMIALDSSKTNQELGHKKDQAKQKWNLLDMKCISEVVDVLTFGANKYSDDNWKYVPNGTDRYYAATMRHLSAWRMGEVNDKETGKSHLTHAICCLIFLWCFDNGKDKT